MPLARTMYQGLLWGDHPLAVCSGFGPSCMRVTRRPGTIGRASSCTKRCPRRSAINSIRCGITRAAGQSTPRSNKSIVPCEARTIPADAERGSNRRSSAAAHGAICGRMSGTARQREKAPCAGGVQSCAQSTGEKGDWDPVRLLEQAWVDYTEAVRRLLVNEGTRHGAARGDIALGAGPSCMPRRRAWQKGAEVTRSVGSGQVLRRALLRSQQPRRARLGLREPG